MIYPALVVFVILAVLALMIYFVIPHLSEVLKETGQELPVITEMVIGLSDFLRSWGWILILGIIGLTIFTFRYSKTSEGKKFFDRIFLQIPLIGSFLKIVYLSRFAENLSTLITELFPLPGPWKLAETLLVILFIKKLFFRLKIE